MDYELQIKIKNAPMLNRMREAGIYTAAELHRETGVTQSVIGQMLALKIPLYCKNTARNAAEPYLGPRVAAIRIADRLGCSPEDLYPREHWFDGLEKSDFFTQVTRNQMESLTHYSTGDPAELLEYLEEDASLNAEKIINAVDKLNARENKILKLRYNENKTLKEIAEELGIRRERVRQIEAKALRKMRHPSVSNELKRHLIRINKQ